MLPWSPCFCVTSRERTSSGFGRPVTHQHLMYHHCNSTSPPSVGHHVLYIALILNKSECFEKYYNLGTLERGCPSLGNFWEVSCHSQPPVSLPSLLSWVGDTPGNKSWFLAIGRSWHCGDSPRERLRLPLKTQGPVRQPSHGGFA